MLAHPSPFRRDNHEHDNGVGEECQPDPPVQHVDCGPQRARHREPLHEYHRDRQPGYFDWESKTYQPHEVDEQVELLSLAGDLALGDGEPAVHAHVVVGRRDTTTRGGHLIEATVRPTLELIIEDTPAHLEKRVDPETGLALIAP